MKLIALVALLASAGCRRPLEPGETRCTSVPLGNGMSTTRCNSGPPAVDPMRPAPVIRGNGYWCATTAQFGACYPVAGGCEKFRMSLAENCGEAGCPTVSACFQQQYAMCSPAGCFVDPASCRWAEKQNGRDGSACYARQ